MYPVRITFQKTPMNMEQPSQEPSKEERIATLKRLIAENSRDLETLGGQDAIDAQRAIEVYQKDLEALERGE